MSTPRENALAQQLAHVVAERDELRDREALRELAREVAETQVAVVTERLDGLETTFTEKLRSVRLWFCVAILGGNGAAAVIASAITRTSPEDFTRAALSAVAGIF